MYRINLDLPRSALVLNICIAVLAAVAIAIVIGTQTDALVGVLILAAVLPFALLAAAERAGYGPGRRAGGGLTDPATGLATEALAAEVLSREFAAARRGRLITLVLIRLEGLTRYRADHGEAGGERLLRAAGRTLARNRRQMDLAALHGPVPGTFLSLLSGTDTEGAAIYAERVRKDLMNLKGIPPHEGVSFAIASFEPTMSSAEELVRKASWALETAGGSGFKATIMGGRVVTIEAGSRFRQDHRAAGA